MPISISLAADLLSISRILLSTSYFRNSAAAPAPDPFEPSVPQDGVCVTIDIYGSTVKVTGKSNVDILLILMLIL